MSESTYLSSKTVSFIVQSTAGKKLDIFQYPLVPGQMRDLLKIPTIGESDIRDSLLKGRLQYLLSTKQIKIVFSDLDLAEKNIDQANFLSTNGLSNINDNPYGLINVNSINITPIKTSNYNAVINEFVRCDPSSGGFTVHLPSAVNNINKQINIKNVTNSSNIITITATGSEKMDGASSQTMTAGYQNITLISDGSNWMIM